MRRRENHVKQENPPALRAISLEKGGKENASLDNAEQGNLVASR